MLLRLLKYIPGSAWWSRVWFFCIVGFLPSATLVFFISSCRDPTMSALDWISQPGPPACSNRVCAIRPSELWSPNSPVHKYGYQMSDFVVPTGARQCLFTWYAHLIGIYLRLYVKRWIKSYNFTLIYVLRYLIDSVGLRFNTLYSCNLCSCMFLA